MKCPSCQAEIPAAGEASYKAGEPAAKVPTRKQPAEKPAAKPAPQPAAPAGEKKKGFLDDPALA